MMLIARHERCHKFAAKCIYWPTSVLICDPWDCHQNPCDELSATTVPQQDSESPDF